MQLAVSFDKDGKILMMFQPAQTRTSKGAMEYRPVAGENHQVFELPKELEGKSMQELGKVLRVNVRGAKPSLEAKA